MKSLKGQDISGASTRKYSFQPTHREILTPEAQALLPLISQVKLLDDFYLVGGTALALYLGHRISVDFDFFTHTSFPSSAFRDFQRIAPDEFQLFNAHDGSLEFSLRGVKIMLWQNFYPLEYDLQDFAGIKLAHPADIGFLKLIALEGRTTWKDIVDLYFLDQKLISIQEMLQDYQRRLPKEFAAAYINIKNLIDPEMLRKSPKPHMLMEVDFDKAYAEVSRKLVRGLHAIIG